MNKQQLITQCREILAESEYQEEWCVNMAAALLPCLEAKPVFFVEIEGDDWTNSGRIEGDERPDLGLLPEGINHLYSAPPVPELKLPPRMTNSNQLATEGTLWNDCLDVIESLNAPHTAPIEPIGATGSAEWVKIEDEPPRDGSWCIAIEEGNFAGDVVYWENGAWKSEFGRDEYTHWMYHPAAPEVN